MAEFFNRQWRLPNNENKAKQSNYSMDFDSSDYIDLGEDLFSTLTSNFSISFWANPTGATANKDFMAFTFGSSNIFYNTFFLNFNDESITFKINNTSLWQLQFPTDADLANFTAGWNHYVVVYTSGTTSTCKFYINNSSTSFGNGTLIANFSTAPTPNAATGFPLKIGNPNPYSSGCEMDAVSIFNYALSQSQITTLYGSSSTGIGNPMSLSPKPVAYYPLGDQDVYNGADYLVPNASLQDYVFDFSGLQNIDCTNNSSLTPTSAISISLWVKTSDTGNFRGLIDKWNGGSSTGYMIDLGPSGSNQGKARFSISDQTSVVTTVAINDGAWHHIVVTCDNTDGFIYLDGVQNSTGSLTMTGITNSHNLKIASDNSSTLGFDGEISNVQIFNTALSATGSNSVETLYNNGSPLTSMSGFTSLQGWWKLDASATFDGSNWSIPDDSSNSNTGTSSGMSQANLVQSDLSFTSGYSPYALQLDGTSNYITVSNSTAYSSYSVSCWVNAVTLPSYGRLVSLDSVNHRFLGLHFDGTLISGYRPVGGSWNQLFTSSTITTGTWNHIVLVDNGTNTKIYVNGVENTLSNSIAVDGPTYYIGTYGVQLSNFFDGKLSNISTWNAALTPTQVTEIYNEGVPSNLNNHSAYSNLVSWWQLGSNSSFNSNSWTCLDEKGTNTGVSSTNMSEVDIVNGVGYSSNGVSSGMSDNVVGDAPYSTANSLSVNMDVLDRTTNIPS